ncbi:hypothetical protein [Terribacillus sp. DMT04]|uniref:hypothetical protein n=1 Tax=Terribacillus sp. DMT04 TaxID=2850441 RepID=UPI001C2BA1DD|nr:hypothetical protein [Terribacillus sp. DMT04]QXE01579.1 hypothetical protein KS242_16695 [Terribacillus sp. DMT04]
MEAKPNLLYSMLDGYKPIRNLLGLGDPCVEKIEDQWWMFFGGFQRNFRNNLFSASLPKGEPLTTENRWRISTYPGKPHKAKPLLPQPKEAAWDRYGLHEPCYVEGKADGAPVRRIYYTGRSASNVLGNESPYSIGCLELRHGRWFRHPNPVMIGTVRNDSVLAPKVIYDEGKWKMWFAATPHEPGKGDIPMHEVYAAESENGLDTWSKPRLFFTREDAFTHARPKKINNTYYLLVSRCGNAFGEDTYKPQDLWLFKSDSASFTRADWSEAPKLLIKADTGEDWYQNGIFGSCLCVDDNGEMVIFFSAINKSIYWLNEAGAKLKQGKKPPFPAPFYFTVGNLRVKDVQTK